MILHERHKIQYLTSIAVMFLILGLGNVIYGHAKYKEYKSIFKETVLEINKSDSPNELEDTSLMSNDTFTERTRHLKRSHGRIIFYQFFVNGGKIFLCISLFFFLVIFAILTKNKKKQPEINT